MQARQTKWRFDSKRETIQSITREALNYEATKPLSNTFFRTERDATGRWKYALVILPAKDYDFAQLGKIFEDELGYYYRQGKADLPWYQCVYYYDGTRWIDYQGKPCYRDAELPIVTSTNDPIRKGAFVIIDRVAKEIATRIQKEYDIYMKEQPRSEAIQDSRASAAVIPSAQISSSATVSQQVITNQQSPPVTTNNLTWSTATAAPRQSRPASPAKVVSATITSPTTTATTKSASTTNSSSPASLSRIASVERIVQAQTRPATPPPAAYSSLRSSTGVGMVDIMLSLAGAEKGKVTQAQLDRLMADYIGDEPVDTGYESDAETKKAIRAASKAILPAQAAVQNTKRSFDEATTRNEEAKRARKETLIEDLEADSERLASWGPYRHSLS